MTTTLTRADIIEALSRELNLPRQKATHFLEFFIETTMNSIAEAEKLKLSSFGTFKVRKKEKRIGRNPKTREKAIVTPRRVVSFHPCFYLRTKVQVRQT
jgi:integration host factor subunit alpha